MESLSYLYIVFAFLLPWLVSFLTLSMSDIEPTSSKKTSFGVMVSSLVLYIVMVVYASVQVYWHQKTGAPVQTLLEGALGAVLMVAVSLWVLKSMREYMER